MSPLFPPLKQTPLLSGDFSSFELRSSMLWQSRDSMNEDVLWVPPSTLVVDDVDLHSAGQLVASLLNHMPRRQLPRWQMQDLQANPPVVSPTGVVMTNSNRVIMAILEHVPLIPVIFDVS